MLIVSIHLQHPLQPKIIFNIHYTKSWKKYSIND